MKEIEVFVAMLRRARRKIEDMKCCGNCEFWRCPGPYSPNTCTKAGYPTKGNTVCRDWEKSKK